MARTEAIDATPVATVEGFNLEALQKFDRVDRLRILLGAKWCNCGCGLLDHTSYRVLADLTKLPLGTLNKMVSNARIFLPCDTLTLLCDRSQLTPDVILELLNAHKTPVKEIKCPPPGPIPSQPGP
jgi:hypothetical protein